MTPDCPAPVPLAAIGADLDAAEAAWVALDDVAMSAALVRVDRALPCVGDAVGPALAARYHRAHAVLDWGAGRDADARISLAALARIAPGEPLPTDLVPEGHALHEALAGAHPGPTETVARPRRAELLFDGTATLERPGDPTIAQLRERGAVVFTQALRPADPLPPYELARDPVPARWYVGGGFGIAAAGLLGGAYAAQSAFDGYAPARGTAPEDAYDTLVGRQRTANRLVVGSAASLAVGVAVAVIPW